jgi:hypothetical protein
VTRVVSETFPSDGDDYDYENKSKLNLENMY